MRISDWSSDVCSSDLRGSGGALLQCKKTMAAERAALFRPFGVRDDRPQQKSVGLPAAMKTIDHKTLLTECTLPAALEAVGERWSFLILRGVFNGLHHFEEFQSTLGIARNILSNRLARLEIGRAHV